MKEERESEAKRENDPAGNDSKLIEKSLPSSQSAGIEVITLDSDDEPAFQQQIEEAKRRSLFADCTILDKTEDEMLEIAIQMSTEDAANTTDGSLPSVNVDSGVPPFNRSPFSSINRHDANNNPLNVSTMYGREPRSLFHSSTPRKSGIPMLAVGPIVKNLGTSSIVLPDDSLYKTVDQSTDTEPKESWMNQHAWFGSTTGFGQSFDATPNKDEDQITEAIKRSLFADYVLQNKSEDEQLAIAIRRSELLAIENSTNGSSNNEASDTTSVNDAYDLGLDMSDIYDDEIEPPKKRHKNVDDLTEDEQLEYVLKMSRIETSHRVYQDPNEPSTSASWDYDFDEGPGPSTSTSCERNEIKEKPEVTNKEYDVEPHNFFNAE